MKFVQFHPVSLTGTPSEPLCIVHRDDTVLISPALLERSIITVEKIQHCSDAGKLVDVGTIRIDDTTHKYVDMESASLVSLYSE